MVLDAVLTLSSPRRRQVLGSPATTGNVSSQRARPSPTPYAIVGSMSSHLPIKTRWYSTNNQPIYIHRWPSEQQPPSRVLFFLPGNPGNPGFYTEFLNLIYARYSSELEIITVGLPGHGRSHLIYQEDGNTPIAPFGLLEQKQYVMDSFDAIRQRYPLEVKYILSGHSLGGYFSVELLEAWCRVPGVEIEKVWVLFPVLMDINPTPNAPRMRSIVKHSLMHTLIAYPLHMIGMLPSWLLHGLLSLSFPKHAANVISQDLLHQQIVRSCFHLVRDEFNLIREPNPILGDDEMAPRVVGYLSEADGWASQAIFETLESRFQKATWIRCPQNLPHAFSIDHNEQMAEIVFEWLDELDWRNNQI